MFSPFRNNNNDRGDGDEGPRFIFANLRRPSRPILLAREYRVFTTTTTALWLFLVIVVWILRFEVSVSRDLMASIAGSSVELAGLTLAVLGLLHEFNKKDKWFKVGLLFVGVLFVSVVLVGFLLSLSWKPDYDSPQQITVVLIGILALVVGLQIDWRVRLRALHLEWLGKRIRIPSRFGAAFRKVRPYIPFALPLLLVWFPGLNRIAAPIVLFIGAILALVVLMGVTTAALLSRRKEEPEDPFLETLRARYQNEIEVLIRFGEVKARILDTMQVLQTESQQEASADQRPREPKMVERADIVSRLRRLHLTEDQEFIHDALRSLVSEGRLCRTDYSGPYWMVPEEASVNSCLPYLSELAMIITEKNSRRGRDDNRYYLESYRFDRLRSWIAIKAQLPPFVVGEYVMPRILERLTSPEHFDRIDYAANYIFVNRNWDPPRMLWEMWQRQASRDAQQRWVDRNYPFEDNLQKVSRTQAASADFLKASGYWPQMISSSEYQTAFRESLLQNLPQTDDGSHYSFRGLNEEQFQELMNMWQLSLLNGT